MTTPNDVLRSNIAVLEDHVCVLRGAIDATRAWAMTRPDSVQFTAVDRKGQERVEGLIAQALYGIWEGTVLEVRLEHSHNPWVVALVNHQIQVNAQGVSYEGAANALLEAAIGAVEQLRTIIG